jgi:hypothetical protein
MIEGNAMLAEPPASWEKALDLVSNVLGVPVANLDPRYSALCQFGSRQAWQRLYQTLMPLGYGATNLTTNDQIVQFTIMQGAIIALDMAAVYTTYSEEQLKNLDVLKRENGKVDLLQALSVGGNPVAPAAGESPVGGVSFGQVGAITVAKQRLRQRYWR